MTITISKNVTIQDNWKCDYLVKTTIVPTYNNPDDPRFVAFEVNTKDNSERGPSVGILTLYQNPSNINGIKNVGYGGVDYLTHGKEFAMAHEIALALASKQIVIE